jgi:hypothetical protein
VIEAWACSGGCLGGPFTVQEPCLARFHLASWLQESKEERSGVTQAGAERGGDRFQRTHPLAPRPGVRLDANLKTAMEKLRRIDEVIKKLPGIDCGSCGSPTCLSLAEDIVQGLARETDCRFVVHPKQKLPLEKRNRFSRKFQGARKSARPKKQRGL